MAQIYTPFEKAVRFKLLPERLKATRLASFGVTNNNTKARVQIPPRPPFTNEWHTIGSDHIRSGSSVVERRY